MDKIKEKTIALMLTIDDVFFPAFIKSRENPELRTLVRVLDNVHEYLSNFAKFCENGEKIDEILNSTGTGKKIDELLNSMENGQENGNISGEAE